MSTLKPRKKLRRLDDWGPWHDKTEYAAIKPAYRASLIAWKVNSVYSVRIWKQPNRLGGAMLISDWTEDGLVSLSIMRRDAKPMGSGGEGHWPTLQRIKDELGYAHRLAVEVYPPKDLIVDPSNLYYLWVLPVGFALPFRLFDPADIVGEHEIPTGILP